MVGHPNPQLVVVFLMISFLSLLLQFTKLLNQPRVLSTDYILPRHKNRSQEKYKIV